MGQRRGPRRLRRLLCTCSASCHREGRARLTPLPRQRQGHVTGVAGLGGAVYSREKVGHPFGSGLRVRDWVFSASAITGAEVRVSSDSHTSALWTKGLLDDSHCHTSEPLSEGQEGRALMVSWGKPPTSDLWSRWWGASASPAPGRGRMLTGGKRYVGCRVVERSLDGPVPVQQHFCNTLLDALFLGAHDSPLKVNSRRGGVGWFCWGWRPCGSDRWPWGKGCKSGWHLSRTAHLKQFYHTMEYYSAIKKNSFESVLMRWMKLESIIQSEVSQKDKDHYSILTHIYGI